MTILGWNPEGEFGYCDELQGQGEVGDERLGWWRDPTFALFIDALEAVQWFGQPATAGGDERAVDSQRAVQPSEPN